MSDDERLFEMWLRNRPADWLPTHRSTTTCEGADLSEGAPDTADPSPGAPDDAWAPASRVATATAYNGCAMAGAGGVAVSGPGTDALAAAGPYGVAVSFDGGALAGAGGLAVVLGKGRASGALGALLCVRGAVGIVGDRQGQLLAGRWYHNVRGRLVIET